MPTFSLSVEKNMKAILTILIIYVISIAPAQGQTYYHPKTMAEAKEYPFYTTVYTDPIGDSLTGMLFFEHRFFCRDSSIYMNWRIDKAIDENGNVYKSYLTEREGSNIYDNIMVVPKGMFSEHTLVGAETIIVPSSVKTLKEAKFIYGLGKEAVRYKNENYYGYKWHTIVKNIEIRWRNRCHSKANHPAEFYFNKDYGKKEIVTGTSVTPYTGKTSIKKHPVCIHLTGAIGNNNTGEVCLIFSVYGNTDFERLLIRDIIAYDDEGTAHNYHKDYFGFGEKEGECIGKYYGCPIEFSLIAFKVPIGTPSLQKMKMTGETDISHSYYNDVEFEWKNIPIQWITPKN